MCTDLVYISMKHHSKWKRSDDDGGNKVQLHLFTIYNIAMKRIIPIVVKTVVAIVFPVCFFHSLARMWPVLIVTRTINKRPEITLGKLKIKCSIAIKKLLTLVYNSYRYMICEWHFRGTKRVKVKESEVIFLRRPQLWPY